MVDLGLVVMVYIDQMVMEVLVEESWEERMLHEAYPQCQFFEHSQRTFRLVQIVNLVLYFVLDAMVWRNYIEFYHDRIIFCLLYLHRNSAYS